VLILNGLIGYSIVKERTRAMAMAMAMPSVPTRPECRKMFQAYRVMKNHTRRGAGGLADARFPKNRKGYNAGLQ
jgi:hypothetical protein